MYHAASFSLFTFCYNHRSHGVSGYSHAVISPDGSPDLDPECRSPKQLVSLSASTLFLDWLIIVQTILINFIYKHNHDDDDEDWCFMATFVHMVG
jgi:hypothetical protein